MAGDIPRVGGHPHERESQEVGHPLPWTRMRSVYRLQGLVRRYGPGPVETACARALDLEVVSVSKIASMLEKATERGQPVLPAAAGSPGGRFARDPSEYSPRGSVQLTLIPGGDPASTRPGTDPELEPTR